MVYIKTSNGAVSMTDLKFFGSCAECGEEIELNAVDALKEMRGESHICSDCKYKNIESSFRSMDFESANLCIEWLETFVKYSRADQKKIIANLWDIFLEWKGMEEGEKQDTDADGKEDFERMYEDIVRPVPSEMLED